MKRAFTILLVTILFSSISNDAFSQYYERSAGIRLGGSYGLTYKKHFSETEAIEFLIGGREEGMHLTGLYLFNKPLGLSKNETFFLYYGPGVHLGYEKYPRTILSPNFPNDPFNPFYTEEKVEFSMGIDAMVGLEYRILTAPLTIGLDIKPYLSFIGFRYLRADFWDVSLSVKYMITTKY